MLNLTGDGGFGINPSCLAAAVEHGIACTWVVMNNSAFGTIAGLENANYQTKFGTVFYDAQGERYSPSWLVWPRTTVWIPCAFPSAEELPAAWRRP